MGGICRVLPMRGSPGGPGGKLRRDRVDRAKSPRAKTTQRKLNAGTMPVTGVLERNGIASAMVSVVRGRRIPEGGRETRHGPFYQAPREHDLR